MAKYDDPMVVKTLFSHLTCSFEIWTCAVSLPLACWAFQTWHRVGRAQVPSLYGPGRELDLSPHFQK